MIATCVLSLASIAVPVMYVHLVGQALRISALVEWFAFTFSAGR